MQVTSKAPVWTELYVNKMLAALETVPGAVILPPTGYVRLMKSYTQAPNPFSISDDFVESDFPGYVQVVIGSGLLGPAALSNGNGYQWYKNYPFTANSTVPYPSQNVVGYWVEDAASTPNIILSEVFPAPIQVATPLQLIELMIQFAAACKVPTGD